jgi:hypothetical protein
MHNLCFKSSIDSSQFKQRFFAHTKNLLRLFFSYLLQRRFGSLVVKSDSSIVNCLFPGDRGCNNIEPV